MSSTPPRNRPRILLAEDDNDLRFLLERVLGTFAEVVAVVDGVDALMKLEEGFEPHLLITDVMMPRLDGMQLLEAVKNRPETSKIPVIVLTAKGTPKDVISGINKGARSYITKPFRQDDLIKKVKKVLGR